ncbi:hypothetical protein [Streptomyces sp. NPDC057325]|uniref:hypothetical protein n=1 Tax=unclassified Streptomyces TaxID=2593676 RepID=UPI003643612C
MRLPRTENLERAHTAGEHGRNVGGIVVHRPGRPLFVGRVAGQLQPGVIEPETALVASPDHRVGVAEGMLAGTEILSYVKG